MSIKVTLGEVKTQKKKQFPKLMIVSYEGANKGMIVLFSKEKEGIVIANPKTWIVGDYNNNWAMEHFTDYNEPITLQNE